MGGRDSKPTLLPLGEGSYRVPRGQATRRNATGEAAPPAGLAAPLGRGVGAERGFGHPPFQSPTSDEYAEAGRGRHTVHGQRPGENRGSCQPREARAQLRTGRGRELAQRGREAGPKAEPPKRQAGDRRPRPGAPDAPEPWSPSSPPRASITLTLRVVQRLVQGHTAAGAEHALLLPGAPSPPPPQSPQTRPRAGTLGRCCPHNSAPTPAPFTQPRRLTRTRKFRERKRQKMPLLVPVPHGCGGARGAEESELRAWARRLLPTAGGRGSQAPRAHFLRTALTPAFPRSRPGRRSLPAPAPARARPDSREENRVERGVSPGTFGTPYPGTNRAIPSERISRARPALRPALSLSRRERRAQKSDCPGPATGDRPRARPSGTRPRRGRGRPSYPGRPGAEAGLVGSAGDGTAGSASPLPAAGRCGSGARAARSAVVTARAAAPPPPDMLLTSARTRRGAARPRQPRRSPPRGPPPRPLRTGWRGGEA